VSVANPINEWLSIVVIHPDVGHRLRLSANLQISSLPRFELETAMSSEYLQKVLDEKTTQELQTAIETNGLTEEAAVVAKKILLQRGALVPDPTPEDELEEQHEEIRTRSNQKFLTTLALLLVWVFIAVVSGMFDAGQQARLNGSMKVFGLIIAAVWGWDLLGWKKK